MAELRAEFGLDDGQGELTLEVRLPQHGTSAEGDNVTSSGLRGNRRTIQVASMKASKVGVNITVNIQVACGFHNHPHVASAVQIANKSLDGGGVTFLLPVTEPGNLADVKGDVRASVGGEVEHYANNRAVTPSFIHERSVGHNSKGS
jgi:hypothetical protein